MVAEFHLFHGAVLTALVRRDQPLSLSMIETKPKESWSTYRINDAVNLVVKHTTTRNVQKRSKAYAWTFTFSPAQIKQVREGSAWAALVCGATKVDDKDMEICLLEPKQIAKLLDLTAQTQQVISVRAEEGNSLRAYSGRHPEELIVARNRLSNWRVPN